MRIFTICNKSPWPANEGGSIAMNSIIEGLLDAGNTVKVLAVNSDKYAVNIEDIPSEYKEKTGFETAYLKLKVNPVHAFLNLFTSKSYNIERFVSKEMEQKIVSILQTQQFDIINLEMLHTTPYIDIIRKYSKAKIVLRAHNIEHLIWERIYRSTHNPVKKFYVRHLASTLKKYELDVLQKIDGLAAITATDAAFFRKCNPQLPVADIPFGVELSEDPCENVPVEFPSLFHLGSMNWIPNSDGIRWFLDEVWPLIHSTYPELKFYLAGRHMPQWLLQRSDPNVINVGEVENAACFMASKPIMIVPLLSGSGIRIKIIEGMLASRTVISTAIGAEGINCHNNKDIIIADSPQDFVAAIGNLISNAELCKQIGTSARETILQYYDNKVIIARLLSFYNSLL